MVNANTIKKAIDSICQGVVEKADESLEGIILTGSMASYMKDEGSAHHPGWNSIPDVNLYVFTDSKERQVRMNKHLGESINETAAGYDNLNFLLDLHPSTIYVGQAREDKNNLQLTTRTISTENVYEIADYCWHGWNSNYLTLHPPEKDFFAEKNIPKMKKDERWLRNMYVALVSYGNICILSPLADLEKQDQRMFDEGFRYLKEVAKDGVQVGLGDEENGDSVIKNWRYEGHSFYRERYGEQAAAIIELLNSADDNYWNMRKESYGLQMAESAVKLRNIVFKKGFLERMREIGSRKGSLQILENMYGELPHWY